MTRNEFCSRIRGLATRRDDAVFCGIFRLNPPSILDDTKSKSTGDGFLVVLEELEEEVTLLHSLEAMISKSSSSPLESSSSSPSSWLLPRSTDAESFVNSSIMVSSFSLFTRVDVSLGVTPTSSSSSLFIFTSIIDIFFTLSSTTTMPPSPDDAIISSRRVRNRSINPTRSSIRRIRNSSRLVSNRSAIARARS